MISISTRLKHYKRRDVQEEMIYHAMDREVAIRFNESFGKRPDVLNNPRDILELVKQGATSFHVSEEIWNNPLQLSPEMRKQDLDKLRRGWDLVIDVDCPVWEYSKLITFFIIHALEENGVSSISCKFSGNKGFHIGVPFEAFPEKVNKVETRLRFPDGVKIIAAYLIHEMDKGERFTKFILKKGLGDLLQKTGRKKEELVKWYCSHCKKIGVKREQGKCHQCKRETVEEKLDVDELIQVDTLLISSRHLYRMPYSLHEKSGLVSLPLDPKEVLKFEKEFASPEKVKISEFTFLEREKVNHNNATLLFDRAFQWHIEKENEELKAKTQDRKKMQFIDDIQTALPEELFPPCIQLIQKGLHDGRKRAAFILINFLQSVGYDYSAIEKKLSEWNKRNPELLREVIIKGQLHHHKQQQKKILPPNCKNEMYMLSMGVCKPDNFCSRIKNPAQYTKKKAWLINRDAPKKKVGKKKDVKEVDKEKKAV